MYVYSEFKLQGMNKAGLGAFRDAAVKFLRGKDDIAINVNFITTFKPF